MTVPVEPENIYAVPSHAALIAGQSAASHDAEAKAREASIIDVMV
jgi:hypothetical protein